MDVSKLDKMKVVELRAELTARGLDTKGVKAVLVERLKAAIEDGAQTTVVTETESSGNPPGTPVPATPSRRHRRTRSVTRSPSPPKRAEVVLEVLREEPQVESMTKEEEPTAIEASPEKSRKSEKQTTTTTSPEKEKQRQKTPVAVTPEKKTEVKETPKKESGRKSRTSQTPEKVTPKKSSRKMSTDKNKTLEEPMEQDEPMETKEEKVEAIVQSKEVIPTKEAETEPPPSPKPMETELEKTPEVTEESVTDKAEPKQDESNKPDDSGDNENVTNQGSSLSESNLDEVSQDTSLNRKLSTEDDKSSGHTENRAKKRKRSHSRSRSRSRSRSGSRDRRSRSKSDSRSRSRSRSKSSSRSRKSKSEHQSKSRSRSRSKGPKSKTFTAEELKGFGFINEEDEPSIEDKVVGLSWFDSDLHLRIDPVSFVSAKPISEDALALAWSGVRTTYGVNNGKIAYEVRLSEESNASHLRGEEHLRAFRCGFSTTKGNLMLGQNENSFAFCYSGKKCSNGECADYGKPYGLDDVIGCYLNLEETPCKIEFTLNGEALGTAFEFEKSSLGEEALFPHILTKGYEFQVNFADNDNLLANVVRPKREKKVVEPEPIEILKQPEDTCEEKWDEDEPMQPVKQPEKDESKDKSEANGEKVETSDTKDDTEMKDVEGKDEEMKDVQSEDKKENNEEEEKKEENVNSKENEESESKPEQDEQKDDKDKHEVQAAATETETETEAEVREPVHLLPDYKLIGLVEEDSLVSGLQRPEKREDCEVILMVGLPGSGKTHWAQNHAKEHPDKMYNIIGFEGIYDKMKVDGQQRKSVHKGNWERFHELCEKSLTLLEEIAAKRRRNYILDQTNVYASCQRRKMKGFGDFKRIAVICIPREDELKRRNDLKTEEHGSNLINESTLNKMKANFTLPSAEFCWFDEVRYVDLDEDESKKEVNKYNSKALSVRSDRSSSGGYKRPRMDNYRRDRPRHDDRRRDDNRGSRWGNDRRGQNRWGGPQGGGGGGGGSGGRGGGHWRDDRGYGGGGGMGGGGYDRRDNRYGGGVNNWAHNPRPPRYDDRGYRPAPSGGGGGGGVGGGNRYDYGGSRDRYDRDRNGSGGGRRDSYHRGSNQRDFRAGHRDHRTEDSRGGYDRSSTKYAKDDYEYKTTNRAGSNGSKSTNKQSSANQNSYGSQQANWNMSASQHQTSGGYWGYDAMHQSYSAPPAQQQQPPPQQQQQQQQQHWQMNSADPRQQQQWMNWWNQQQADPQQYWSQYPQHAYVHQPTSSHGDVASSMPKGASMGGGNRSSESKKP